MYIQLLFDLGCISGKQDFFFCRADIQTDLTYTVLHFFFFFLFCKCSLVIQMMWNICVQSVAYLTWKAAGDKDC